MSNACYKEDEKSRNSLITIKFCTINVKIYNAISAVIQTCLVGLPIQADALTLCKMFPTKIASQQSGCDCISTGAAVSLMQSHKLRIIISYMHNVSII